MAKVSSSNGIEKYPKLRFPEFDEQWETTQLRTYFKKNTRKNTTGAVTNVISNSAKNGLIPQKDYFDKDIANADNTAGYYIISKNDFVYNPRKSSDAPYGPISRYSYDEDGIVSPLYLCFRGSQDINPRFFEKYFKSSVWHRYIYMTGDSGARHDRVSIKDETFFEMPIHMPCESEQSKIVSFITLVEQRVDTQLRLVESLKKYKRGVMQSIFREMADYKELTVGDVFMKVNRRNKDGVVKNVITNSAEFGLIPQRDFFDKDIAVDGNTENYYIIKKDDFVYNPRKSNSAPYGPFNCYQSDEEGIISPLYTCLVKKINIDSSYLSWYFKSDSWYRYIYDNGSQGVRHDRVSMTDELLMGIPIKIPSSTTQKQIAAFLDQLEKKLQREVKIYEALLKMQKALYTQLFI